MGRHRRAPKDDKDAKELERLRRNQANCRKRKLDQIDQFKKTIEDLETTLREKFKTQEVYIHKINELKADMARLINGGVADPNQFQIICGRVDLIQAQLEQMKAALESKDDPSASSERFDGPSTSREHNPH